MTILPPLHSQNVFSAILTLSICLSSARSRSGEGGGGGGVLSRRCSSPRPGLSVLKAQSLLLMALVVVIVNLVHLVILEVGEWRGFLSEDDKKYIENNGLQHKMKQGD